MDIFALYKSSSSTSSSLTISGPLSQQREKTRANLPRDAEEAVEDAQADYLL